MRVGQNIRMVKEELLVKPHGTVFITILVLNCNFISLLWRIAEDNGIGMILEPNLLGEKNFIVLELGMEMKNK